MNTLDDLKTKEDALSRLVLRRSIRHLAGLELLEATDDERFDDDLVKTLGAQCQRVGERFYREHHDGGEMVSEIALDVSWIQELIVEEIDPKWRAGWCAGQAAAEWVWVTKRAVDDHQGARNANPGSYRPQEWAPVAELWISVVIPA